MRPRQARDAALPRRPSPGRGECAKKRPRGRGCRALGWSESTDRISAATRLIAGDAVDGALERIHQHDVVDGAVQRDGGARPGGRRVPARAPRARPRRASAIRRGAFARRRSESPSERELEDAVPVQRNLDSRTVAQGVEERGIEVPRGDGRVAKLLRHLLGRRREHPGCGAARQRPVWASRSR